MGNILETPVTTKMSSQFISHTKLHGGLSGMQGYRMEMEDTHILADMPSCKDVTIAAIFDGHGGNRTAEYASNNLIHFIESSHKWKEYIRTKSPHDLSEALIEAFLQIDATMQADANIRKSMVHCGTTAVVAMITHTHIVCANAGDSRCVLGVDDSSINLSEDHKPALDVESDRIKAAGGFIAIGRVEGDLAVSRGFGDFHFKERDDLPQQEQKVTCNPDITIHKRSSKDEMLIVACDGLWDVYSSADAVRLVRDIFAEGETDESLVAEELLDMALQKGSKDNISALVVRLEGAVIGPASLGGVKGRRKLREDATSARIDESKAP